MKKKMLRFVKRHSSLQDELLIDSSSQRFCDLDEDLLVSTVTRWYSTRFVDCNASRKLKIVRWCIITTSNNYRACTRISGP